MSEGVVSLSESSFRVSEGGSEGDVTWLMSRVTILCDGRWICVAEDGTEVTMLSIEVVYEGVAGEAGGIRIC